MRRAQENRPAVFLDRDGTIIEDRGDLAHPSQVVFFPETLPALRRLQAHFDLFLITNQSGVAKGRITLEDVERVNACVLARLAEDGLRIRAVYVCPHDRGDGCACIKPKPFFLHRAEREYGIDLRRSFTVGDHPHDVVLATNVGARGIFVLTGHGEQHRDELPEGSLVAAGIGEAANLILGGGAR